MFWPCETRTSTCRSFATISSGLYRFLAIAVLLDVKDIPQVGPLQWGWISTRVGFTEERIRVGQWLFVRYGGRFVFIARFLPFLRNIAAVLAGTNSMAQHSFYFASATAAAAWIITYGLSAYSFGGAFANFVSPAAVVLGLAATLIVLATPVLILRYERSLLVEVERQFPGRFESRRRGAGRVHDAGQQGRRCVQRAVFADAAPQPRLIIERPAEFRLPAISQLPDTAEGAGKCSAVR